MAASKKTSKVPLCFVVGPIGKDASPERRPADLLLHSVIKHVLESEEFGYRVKRADEDADPGMIGDRVISDIIHADLVVADLTDLNPNAFYELGIRHSTEKPTIHIGRSGTQLPFDNVSHRTIFVDLTDWHSIEAGRNRLADSARAIKDLSYQVSNPITQANASFKMRESADPRDQVIADMQQRIHLLESMNTRRSRPITPDVWVEIENIARQGLQENWSLREIMSAIKEYSPVLVLAGIEGNNLVFRSADTRRSLSLPEGYVAFPEIESVQR
jgi:hypothetical protein